MSESFDRVKLSRLKYLQWQANKYLTELTEFQMVVSLFTVIMESLIFENTYLINIVCENRVNMVLISCVNMLLV